MNPRPANLLILMLAAVLAAAVPAASLAAKTAPAALPADAPFWAGKPDAAGFAKMEAERLAKTRQAIERLVAVKGARTIGNTLVPFDEVQILLDAAGA